MQTREKLGAQAKKMLKLLQDQKDNIIDGYQFILTCRDLVLPDIKKLIELLFIFEGIGFITRISKKRFIFSGLKGTISRILEGIEFAIQRLSIDREHWLFSEDFIIETKRYSIRQSVYLGLFYQEILSQVFYYQTRTIARDTMERLLDQLLLSTKDQNNGVIFNEMVSIMTSLNLLDKKNAADQYEQYQWIGPDIIAPLNLEQYHPFSINLRDQLNMKNKLTFEKEQTYYTNLYRDLYEQIPATEYGLCQPHINFPSAAYALIKGKHITYYIKKLAIIIGRCNISKNSKYQWDVDLALDSGSKISKQHAVISYNNEINGFEIKCLSNKKSITIDTVTIYAKDNPIALKHRSSIQIGKFIMVFYLPKSQKDGINEEQYIVGE